MHWFAEMMAGRTDRSQYAAGFVAQVTDEAVARISHDLNVYGAAPLRAYSLSTPVTPKTSAASTSTVL